LEGIVHSDVLVQAEVTSEEQGVERRVQRRLEGIQGVQDVHGDGVQEGIEGIEVQGVGVQGVQGVHTHKLHRIIGGSTLYHPADLPYPTDFSTLSDIFSIFRAKVEGDSPRYVMYM
jgi:hypothetical protein